MGAIPVPITPTKTSSGANYFLPHPRGFVPTSTSPGTTEVTLALMGDVTVIDGVSFD